MEEIPIILLGLVVGSFLNVVIFRLPRGEDIVFTPSHCTSCQTPIPFYLNVPIVSYLVLRGRCHRCRKPISPQYPLVEAFTAFGFWLSQHRFGITAHTGMACLFIAILVALALIDLRHMILPDVLTLGGSIVFLAYAFFNPRVPLLDGLLTAGSAALIFGGLFVFYLKIRKIEGLGFGDVKMAVFLGLFLGHLELTIAVLLASLLGLLVGLYFIIFRKKNLKFALPFGTFLAVGGFVSLFWGQEIFTFLLRLTPLHA